jgi:hypothetical protein
MTIMLAALPGDMLGALKGKINLASRLRQYDIRAALTEDRIAVNQILVGNYHTIVDEFYSYLKQLPETAKILRGKNLPLLKEYQKSYWTSLFSSTLDDDFVNRSIIVGFTHFSIGLPPHLYIAGYTFFLNQLTDALLSNAAPERVGRLIKEAQGVIHCDMSISLTAYFYQGLQVMVDNRQGRGSPGQTR